MKKENVLPLLVVCLLLAIIGTIACKEPVNKKYISKLHWIEVAKQGIGQLYIDTVNTEKIIKQTTKDCSSIFRAYRIGFVDERPTGSGSAEKDAHYFGYEMQTDWKAVSNEGEYLTPILYLPENNLNANTYSGILLFEMFKSDKIDTLIYNDSYGSWGTQRIVLTN